MPSTRRFKVVAALFAVLLFCLYYYSNDANTLSSSEFYSRTKAAMERDAQHSSDVQKHESGASYEEPPPIPPVKGGQEHDAVLVAPNDGSVKPDKAKGVAGRKKYKGGEHWDVASGKQAPISGKKKADEEGETKDDTKEEKLETEEEHEVEVELNSILKKGPIIVFSKSYCPYSKKAKDILLEKYTIVPTPYVVELDEHPLGPGLQAALHKSTGRRTVPNVLINGKSIGGGDDVQKLDQDGELVGKVKSMGGKRIMEAKLRGGT
ncbi:MAG: hypothetical protein LQ346_004670 [Caloplaca aetnensis]|nr:MAG: hypothetical protein LQ346_004670 [Caloplaca aetnensis]